MKESRDDNETMAMQVDGDDEKRQQYSSPIVSAASSQLTPSKQSKVKASSPSPSKNKAAAATSTKSSAASPSKSSANRLNNNNGSSLPSTTGFIPPQYPGNHRTASAPAPYAAPPPPPPQRSFHPHPPYGYNAMVHPPPGQAPPPYAAHPPYGHLPYHPGMPSAPPTHPYHPSAYHPSYQPPPPPPPPYGNSVGGPPPPYPGSSAVSGSFDNASIGSNSSKHMKKRSMNHHHPPSLFNLPGSSSNNESGVPTTPPLISNDTMDSTMNQKVRGRTSHRRSLSDHSTVSSVSVGGLSTVSTTTESEANNPLTRSSPKRRRGMEGNPVEVQKQAPKSQQIHRRITSNSSIETSSRKFQKLSMTESDREDAAQRAAAAEAHQIFLSLSTSPIHSDDSIDFSEVPLTRTLSSRKTGGMRDVEATPVSGNTKKKLKDRLRLSNSSTAFVKNLMSVDSYDNDDDERKDKKQRSKSASIDRNAETPTPPLPSEEIMTDQELLRSHLRGQSFTPLPHLDGISPTNGVWQTNSFGNGVSSIQAQLSWSITGDTPSLGDLAEWEEKGSGIKSRPGSTTSQMTSDSASPRSFHSWKDTKSNDLRLGVLSPSSDIDMAPESGTTTPLPLSFDSENGKPSSGEKRKSFGAPDNIMSVFNKRDDHQQKESKSSSSSFPRTEWLGGGGGGPRRPMAQYSNKHNINSGTADPRLATPTHIYSSADYGRSPHHMGRHGDAIPPPPLPLHGDYHYPYGLPPPPLPPGPLVGDRVRNLRGRAPSHHAPMPFHMAPPMSSHHNLTSPMALGPPGGPHGSKIWPFNSRSPHHHPHHHPHLGLPPPLPPIDSKRKCVPLKPPIPSKFQGDMEKAKSAQVPEFTSLVNYPAHMSQKQSMNLPEGMRCCVMCGNACPCLSGGKNNSKAKKAAASMKNEASGRNSSNSNKNNGKNNGGPMMGGDDPSNIAIIPTQNKGLCTLCDVNVWVVCSSGLEIKWCKGCKNFRPWAAFGDKGLATKCLRCRERQREKYAMQKEEKERKRNQGKKAAAAS